MIGLGTWRARLRAMRRGLPLWQSALIDGIPFRRIETTGTKALAVWEALRRQGLGWPVVIGGDVELVRIAEWLQIADPRSPTQILAIADGLRFPEDLRAHVAAGRRHSREEMARWAEGMAAAPTTRFGPDGRQAQPLPPGQIQSLTDAHARPEADDGADAPAAPAVGEWPGAEEPLGGLGLTVAQDHHGQPLRRVHILVLPTADGTAVPAFLNWGGWNENPPAEFHVAALRSWRDRHGAELVGLGNDVMNLRVARRPETRAAALALAREQCLYCEDVVTQGTATLAPLAATLMAGDWWFFWWD